MSNCNRIRTLARLAGRAFLLLGATLALPSFAQTDYPNRPISLVVGFPPGGSNDIVARIYAPKLSEALGTSVVVVNKPGSNALIGTAFVATSAPDGYTVTLGSASPLAISPSTYPKMPFDVLKDLIGITTVANTPELLAVHPSVPARNLQELLALSKTRRVNISSSGNGGLPHLAIELLRKVGTGEIVHVPFKGAGPAVTDTVGGHVDGIIVDIAPLYPFVRDGRLRAIAVTDHKRSSALPDVPTSVEQGAPNLLAFNWFAIMAPARTPAPVIARLHGAILKASADKELGEALRKLGAEPMTHASPEAFDTFLREELDRWGKIAREAGARAD